MNDTKNTHETKSLESKNYCQDQNLCTQTLTLGYEKACLIFAPASKPHLQVHIDIEE